MADHAAMKLGRRAPRVDHRTLRLARYMAPSASPPVAIDWMRGIADFGVMLNDTLGDCAIAACAHAVQIWTANAASEVTLPDSLVEHTYEEWCGYIPEMPGTDRGAAEIDVLNRWRKGDLGGHLLHAYADPDCANLEEIRRAIELFGGVYIGLSLPLTAQEQDVWDLETLAGWGAPGSWGGHAVFVPAYDANGFTCITWGQRKRLTCAFWDAYCDEAHALLSPDWLAAQGSPAGFDLEQLEADLAAIR